MVVHERLNEPLVTKKGLLEKPRSFSNLAAFLDLNGSNIGFNRKSTIKLKSTFNDFNDFLKL